MEINLKRCKLENNKKGPWLREGGSVHRRGWAPLQLERLKSSLKCPVLSSMDPCESTPILQQLSIASAILKYLIFVSSWEDVGIQWDHIKTCLLRRFSTVVLGMSHWKSSSPACSLGIDTRNVVVISQRYQGASGENIGVREMYKGCCDLAAFTLEELLQASS